MMTGLATSSSEITIGQLKKYVGALWHHSVRGHFSIRPLILAILPLLIAVFLFALGRGVYNQLKMSELSALNFTHNALAMSENALLMNLGAALRIHPNQDIAELNTLARDFLNKMHGGEKLEVAIKAYHQKSEEQAGEDAISAADDTALRWRGLERLSKLKSLQAFLGGFDKPYRVVSTQRLIAGGKVLVVELKMDEPLKNWKMGAIRLLTLYVSAAAIIVLVLIAYMLQLARAIKKDILSAKTLEKFETALSQGNSALWDINLTQEKISWSQSMNKIFVGEHTGANVSVEDLSRRIMGEDLDLKAFMREMAITAAKSVQREFRMRGYNGQWTWLRFQGDIIDDARTRARHIVGMATDITELKRYTLELQASETKLEYTILDLKKARQKLETQAKNLSMMHEKNLEEKQKVTEAGRVKSEFLANMSHEFRTPLNAIIGFSEIMQKQTFGKIGNEKYLHYCAHIKDSGQYLFGLINNILHMSQLAESKLKLDLRPCNAKALCARLIEGHAPHATRRNITIALACEETFKIMADEKALNKILGAVLDNALKYAFDSSRISLSICRHGHDVAFTITDEGCGMSEPAITQLGDCFQQRGDAMRNGMKGCGLGLAVAKSLVELHGGRIDIQSSLGVGTSVTAIFYNSLVVQDTLPNLLLD